MGMSMSLSSNQFGGQAMSASGAMPESKGMDGAAPVSVSGVGNKLAANAGLPLPKPGFSN